MVFTLYKNVHQKKTSSVAEPDLLLPAIPSVLGIM